MNSGLELNKLGGLFRISEVLTNLGKNNLNNFTFSCCHAVTSCGKVQLPKKTLPVVQVFVKMKFLKTISQSILSTPIHLSDRLMR